MNQLSGEPDRRKLRRAGVSVPDVGGPAGPISARMEPNPAHLAEWITGRHAGVVFVADDLGGWLIGLLADAGRKKLTTLVLGSEQERALRSAATAAVQQTVAELRPGDDERAEQLALVVSEVFGEPVPGEPLAGQATMLQALQAGIAGQLAVLDDASLTGTGQSSADVLGVAGAAVAQKLTTHLLREVVSRGSRGGPLAPLANQLDMTGAICRACGPRARSTASMTGSLRCWPGWTPPVPGRQRPQPWPSSHLR
jgi:hypothetical protein